jgi:hypothetical protein
LKHQPDVTTFDHIGGEQGLQHFGEFFFHFSCTSGSLFGCRVSGATFRQPCRARSR